jgi:hypothetical protein
MVFFLQSQRQPRRPCAERIQNNRGTFRKKLAIVAEPALPHSSRLLERERGPGALELKTGAVCALPQMFSDIKLSKTY